MINAALFEKMLEDGGIRRLILKKHILPTDVSDQVGGGIVAKDLSMEVSIVAKGKKNFIGVKDKIKSLKNDNVSMLELIKVDGFNPDEIMAEISVDRNTRTVNMNNPNEFGSYYDVTNKVIIDPATGHPTFESIQKEAIDIFEKDIKPSSITDILTYLIKLT